MTLIIVLLAWFVLLVLCLPMIVLRMLGLISWSWWIILAPIYLPIVGIILFIIFYVIPFMFLLFLLGSI